MSQKAVYSYYTPEKSVCQWRLRKTQKQHRIRFLRCFDRSDWIRTSGLLVPNQALYRTEPHPDCLIIISQRVGFVNRNFQKNLRIRQLPWSGILFYRSDVDIVPLPLQQYVHTEGECGHYESGGNDTEEYSRKSVLHPQVKQSRNE